MHYGCTHWDHTDYGYISTYEAPAARRIQRYHLTLAILVLGLVLTRHPPLAASSAAIC